MLITYPLLYLIYGTYYSQSDEIFMGFADFLLSCALPFAGTIAFWMYKSATPGKMSLKQAVVDANTGGKLTVQQSVIRYIGCIISALPLLLEYSWVAFDPKKQALHDKLAGSVVIRSEDSGISDVIFSNKSA